MKYKFRMSESNRVEFTQKEFDEFKNVQYIDDNSMGKVIPVKRAIDNKIYHLLVPLEMIEEVEDEQSN